MTLPALPAKDSTNWYPHYAALDAAVRAGGGGGGGGGDLSAYALRTETPTLEELERVALLGTISATGTRRLGPASFGQRIGGLTLAVSAAVAASDTNYWTVALLRLRGGSSTTIATRTTKATGGEAFTADQGWNFDAMSWSDAGRHLLKGDVLALSFTKTGTPANLTDVTAAVRYEPGVVADGPPVVEPVLRDTFTRADSTSSLGTADTGQTWETPLAGTFGISSNQAYASALTGGFAYVLINSGRSNYTLSARAVTGANQGLVFRAVDYDNLFEAGSNGVHKTAAGVVTQVMPGPPGGLAAGDVLKITVSGPTINYYKNDVLVGTVNDSFNQTATKVGIYFTNTAARFDDLEVTP